MKIKQLTESSNTNLLIIDVQPEYDNWCGNILAGVQGMIEKANGGIYVVYNDFGGGDTLEEVFAYLAGTNQEDEDEFYNDETDEWEYTSPPHTAASDKLKGAKFFQKEFGFLRGWMDIGVSDATIIEVIRAMAQAKAYDSSEVEYETLSENAREDLESIGVEWMNNPISMQDWVPVHFLKSVSPFYMMGGGRQECLREIELFCNAFNIRYKRVDSLIY